MDLTLVIDTSGSILQRNWTDVITFVNGFVTRLDELVPIGANTSTESRYVANQCMQHSCGQTRRVAACGTHVGASTEVAWSHVQVVMNMHAVMCVCSARKHAVRGRVVDGCVVYGCKTSRAADSRRHPAPQRAAHNLASHSPPCARFVSAKQNAHGGEGGVNVCDAFVTCCVHTNLRPWHVLLDLVCGGRGARVRSRVAVVTFSDTADLYMRYKDHLTLGGFVGKMDELLTFATGGTTQTHLALTEVEQAQQSRPLKPDLWPNLAGFVGFSDERASVVLLITDGKPSNPDRAVGMSRALQDKGNTVVVVGVTDSVDQATLDSLASEGKGIRVEDFGKLAREETIELVLEQLVTNQNACPGGIMYNFEAPITAHGIAASDLIRILPELVTVSECADECLKEPESTCYAFGFQQLAAGRGVCRLGLERESIPIASSSLRLKTCDELGWTVFESSLDQNVCGTSNYTASAQCGLALNKMQFATALAACASVGSRFCTGEELQNDVANGDGCDFKNDVRIWTSDSCSENGTVFLSANGGRQIPVTVQPVCTAAGEDRHVRCCADVSSDTDAAAEYAATFSVYKYVRCSPLC